jgi:hypothetical protein
LIESILEEDDENGREYHKAEYFISWINPLVLEFSLLITMAMREFTLPGHSEQFE